MKPRNLSRVVLAAACVFTAASATSCQTTGDPSTGGIFWSESKAQQRLADRQAHLESVERRTAATNRKSAATQRKINDLKQ